MKIEPEYIKELLTLALESEKASLKSKYLKDNIGDSDTEKFVFHLKNSC